MAVQTFGFHASRNEPDQAQRRIDLILLDQHGREWHAIFDTAARWVVTMMPRFAAPWLPDPKYIAAITTRGGVGSMPDAIAIDYRAWLEDNHRAWDKYFDNLLKIGGKMPGVDAMTAYTHAKDGAWEKIPSGLLAELGQTPEPDDYAKAAMADNKWVLGLTAAIPAWAAPLVALKEAQQREASRGVKDGDLDKYRDEEEDFDPDAVGGKVVKVKRPK
jgi:hypothetical protein